MPDVNDDFERQPLLVYPLSDVGPALTKGDVNGDGLEDVLVGGGEAQPAALFVQDNDGTFQRLRQPAFQVHSDAQDVGALFFDSDNDGDQDLYVVSGGYANFEEGDGGLQDRLYVNDGNGQFTYNESALPGMNTSTSVVRASDINQDGYLDLFVGGYVVPGRFPELPRSYVLLNNGNGSFSDQTAGIGMPERPGMVTDAAWADLNGDGVEELVLLGHWMPIQIYDAVDGVLRDVSSTYLNESYSGLWNTLLVEDVTGDGIADIVAGNIGLNTQFHANKEEPAVLYGADFDNNGTVDPLFTYYIDGASYLYPMLDELQVELPLIASRYATHREYGQLTAGEVLGPNLLDATSEHVLTEMETSLFVGTQGGGFEKGVLPVEVQLAPVYTIVSFDANQDGVADLLLAGNTMEGTIRLGKYDASFGTLLKGGGGVFSYVLPVKSGLQESRPVRSSMVIGGKVILGINGSKLTTYQWGVSSY